MIESLFDYIGSLLGFLITLCGDVGIIAIGSLIFATILSIPISPVFWAARFCLFTTEGKLRARNHPMFYLGGLLMLPLMAAAIVIGYWLAGSGRFASSVTRMDWGAMDSPIVGWLLGWVGYLYGFLLYLFSCIVIVTASPIVLPKILGFFGSSGDLVSEPAERVGMSLFVVGVSAYCITFFFPSMLAQIIGIQNIGHLNPPGFGPDWLDRLKPIELP